MLIQIPWIDYFLHYHQYHNNGAVFNVHLLINQTPIAAPSAIWQNLYVMITFLQIKICPYIGTFLLISNTSKAIRSNIRGESDPWNCLIRTFLNDQADASCFVCGVMKPVRGCCFMYSLTFNLLCHALPVILYKLKGNYS